MSLIPRLKLSTIIIERFILVGISCSTSTRRREERERSLSMPERQAGATNYRTAMHLHSSLTLSFQTEPASDHRSKNNNDDSQTNEYNDLLLKKRRKRRCGHGKIEVLLLLDHRSSPRKHEASDEQTRGVTRRSGSAERR